ncbi:TPA: hypothetical protein HA241_06065 [Candidatus Woesearchaeota archaeon]|nr:hypothetical protein [Candidatus Woesearchaeota archaeon]
MNELYLLEEVHEHIAERLWLEKMGGERYPRKFYILPKRFSVEAISPEGKILLPYEFGKEYTLEGILITQRMVGLGRVFFMPEPLEYQRQDRFQEIKGYGSDGSEIRLWLHCSGDIHGGTFLDNAHAEYQRLQLAREAGLLVPLPLMVGKIHRDVWFETGIKVAAKVFKDPELSARFKFTGWREAEAYLKEIASSLDCFVGPSLKEDPLGAFKQEREAGFLIRAPLSPFRLGDPSEMYELNSRNISLARQCGKTFYSLIDLGYLSHCPGTGNWTTAGEFTDLMDCHDLKKDSAFKIKTFIKKAEKEAIKIRESKADPDYEKWTKEIRGDYWLDLIGPYHAGNLSPYFIEGMLGESASLEDAVAELKRKVNRKRKEYGQEEI